MYIRVLGKKNLRVPLDVATVDRKKLLKDMKKFLKVPKKESAENKVTRELEVAATKVKLAEATVIYAIAIQACYDLFRQLLADDPHTNGTASLGRSTILTPGPRWTEQRSGDYG